MKKGLLSFFLFLSCLFSSNAENYGYVAEYGKLKLVGRQLCTENGDTIQLRSISTGVIGEDACLDKNTFKTMKDWGMSSVRLNYAPYTHSDENVAKLKSYIDNCAELGMYAIVDYYIRGTQGNSGNPLDYTEEAKDFFGTISAYAKEKGYIHLIYEICNEPSEVSWEKVKEYAKDVLPVIEANDPGAIVIVGTTSWCQEIKYAVADPINADDYNLGIMYSFHYFACSHYHLLGDLRNAMKSIPVFVSEWTSDKFDLSNMVACDLNSEEMLWTLDSRNVYGQVASWSYWSWGNTGIWKDCKDGVYKENLTATGEYLVNLLKVKLDSKPEESVPEESVWAANFKEYGRLKLVGNQLSAQNGDAIQLKGVCTGIIGEDACLDNNSFKTMKEWGLNSVRLNYSPLTHSDANVAKLKSYIDICAELGLYAIVDWHVLGEGDNWTGDPMDYVDDAKTFFSAISGYVKEKKYMHVLYDICNDSYGQRWKDVKNYAKEILPIIESNDPGAVVIISASTWSDPFSSPIGEENYNLSFVYSYHFAACDNNTISDIMTAMEYYPVFISEWTSSSYKYNTDKVCPAYVEDLFSLLDKKDQIVSWNYWSWGTTGIWKDCADGVYKENLTESGKFLVDLLKVTLDSKPEESIWAANFKEYGRLKLVGNQLSSANDEPIQLKSISTGVIGEGACLDNNTFKTMKKWGLNSVRINYSPYSHSKENVEKLKSYIDICAELGLYAIVDWFILESNLNVNTGNPLDYADDAEAFFATISEYAKEKGYMHLIYEICNKPSVVEWKDVKAYADKILPIIEANDPGAIVIVGTPYWCQRIVEVSKDPISADAYNLGIMYAFHYYACSHLNLLGDLRSAINIIPVYVSEWSSGTFDLDSKMSCKENSDKLLDALNMTDNQVVSWSYWSWGNTGIWKDCNVGVYKDNLTGTGEYLVNLLKVKLNYKPVESAWAENFKEYGRLKLVGRQLCSEKGDTIQLKGFNTGVIGKDIEACLKESAFKTMQSWGCKSVRLNYSPYTHSSYNLRTIKSYIDLCAELGMYAIVDWHIFEEGEDKTGNPLDYLDDAKDFFSSISSYVRENGYMHVLYDICNEPSGVDWKDIKSYAAEILPIIEDNDPGAIVIVGTPNRCQYIYEASLSPISAKNYDLGIMYSFHYAACDYVDLLGNLKNALMSIPVFISDWSSSDYTYQSDKVCEMESNLLLSTIDYYGKVVVSWNYWAWAGETGIWKDCESRIYKEDLTKTGEFIANILGVKLESKPIEYKWKENFADFGRLIVDGDKGLCSEKKEVVQLKGFNTGVIDKDVIDCLSKEAFQAMKDWGCSSVRLNYSPYTHSSENVETIKSYIDICAELGLYAIVDWHIFEEKDTRSGNPNDYIKGATSFFYTVSAYAKEKGYMHLIYDICNEPSGVEWKSIKEYASEILPIIETNDPGAIVIVGTPNGCQRVLDPVNDQIDEKSYDLGIMYSFHYSPCNHLNFLGDLESAMKHYPVFMSKWTSSDYQYSTDEVCSEPADKVLASLDNNHQKVSWNYWAWAGETGIWKECGTDYKKDNLNKVGSYILVDKDVFNYPYKMDTNVEDVDNDGIVNVVPNPASDAFSVIFNGNANVCIYNTIGQKVFDKDASNILNINEVFNAGVYNVIVRGNDYVETVKLIIK